MGCSTCSTKTGDTSPGCKNNGTCGTSGCNKLNVYNWLSDMELPEGQKPFNIVEVRFKGSRKEFFKNSEYLELKVGDVVAVEGNPGHDIGLVSLDGELVRFQLKLNGLNENSDQIKVLYRQARPVDLEKWEAVKALEVNTMYRARSIALQLKLRMKLSDVEYQGDGKKATFYYTADERVDFRELIKKLADEFKIRVEMRQIGLRQEASRLGGIGSCGRELCCSTWLTDFKIVSTSAARYQNLSLNPLKLSGQCGKLKCCLNYELDSYMDALRDIPDSNSRLESQKGWAGHRKTDIFKRMMWFAYTGEEGNAANNSDNWIVLSVDRVKEIIAMNKAGEKPADLNDFTEAIPYEKPMDYADVVGQDSLTRMIDKKKKKKKKKGDNRNIHPKSAGDTRVANQQRVKPSKPERESSDRSVQGEKRGGQPPLQQQKLQDNQVRNRDQNRPPRSPVKPQGETKPQASSPPVQPSPSSSQPQPSQSQPPASVPPKQEQKSSDNPPLRVRQIPPRTNPSEKE